METELAPIALEIHQFDSSLNLNKLDYKTISSAKPPGLRPLITRNVNKYLFINPVASSYQRCQLLTQCIAN